MAIGLHIEAHLHLGILVQRGHIVQQVAQVDALHHRAWHLSEARELGGDVAQRVYLLHEDSAGTFYALTDVGRTIAIAALQHLDVELHWRERILDLVGHLLGHFAPCTFTFAAGKRFGTAYQLAQRAVVFVHQFAYLVLAGPFNGAVGIVEPQVAQAVADDAKRFGDAVADDQRQHYGHQYEKHIDVDERGQQREHFLLQPILPGKVGYAQIGDDGTLLVAERHIGRLIFQTTDVLGVDE